MKSSCGGWPVVTARVSASNSNRERSGSAASTSSLPEIFGSLARRLATPMWRTLTKSWEWSASTFHVDARCSACGSESGWVTVWSLHCPRPPRGHLMVGKVEGRGSVLRPIFDARVPHLRRWLLRCSVTPWTALPALLGAATGSGAPDRRISRRLTDPRPSEPDVAVPARGRLHRLPQAQLQPADQR